MNRALPTVCLALVVLTAGCAGDSRPKADAPTTASATPSKPTLSTCTKGAAVSVRQVTISKGKFQPNCALVKLKAQFFIVNDDKVSYSFATTPGAPEAFNATLDKKASTFARSFSKKGTYEISISKGSETLTVFVD